ncbi:hypothetical protein [Streptomyces pratensis]
MYVVKADADNLTEQRSSACCSGPYTTDIDARDPATAGSCC